MKNIIETDARTITGDYVSNGNHNHFKFGGRIIKGYQFTRKELNNLIKNNSSSELFMMLALSTDSGSKYLNIVVASILNNTMDVGTMIISDKKPYTGSVSFLNDMKIKSLRGPEIEITLAQLNTMQNDFENATSDHLSCTTTKRIKAYTLSACDLKALTLDTKVNTTNENDLFLFMPVIRKKLIGEPADAKDYVSLAIARVDPETMNVMNAIMEYCLPCPTTCATNYWH